MVVRPTVQELRDFTPFVAVDLVQPNDLLVFLGGPFVLLDVGVQVVVPALAALLSDAPWECLRDVRPVLGSELFNIFREFLVFLGCPGTFDHGGIEDFLPAMQALDIGSVVEVRCNLLPVFCAKLVDELGKLLIFLGVPVPFGVVRVRKVVGSLDLFVLAEATVVLKPAFAQTSCLICQTQSPVLAPFFHKILS